MMNSGSAVLTISKTGVVTSGISASGSTAVFGNGSNVGVYGTTATGSGYGVLAEATNTGTAFVANHTGGSGNLVELKN